MLNEQMISLDSTTVKGIKYYITLNYNNKTERGIAMSP